MFISEETIDDLLREVLKAIFESGQTITPAKGPCLELTGILLELKNPRARLSLTETRGKLFSCLGELCWYLSGSGSLEFIKYYIPAYGDFSDGDPVFGAYGPRLFGTHNGIKQVDNIISTLRSRRDSRRAVVQIFESHDLEGVHKEIPCTCTMQFMIRDSKLQMLTMMRSNDLHSGFVHDLFAFTMLQEIIACSLGVEIGTYKHAVGSLHIYDEDIATARKFLAEGWQSTNTMPAMPIGDPWPSVQTLLAYEQNIRSGQDKVEKINAELHPYWADLVRLLLAYNRKIDGGDFIRELRGQIESEVYRPFLDALAARRNGS